MTKALKLLACASLIFATVGLSGCVGDALRSAQKAGQRAETGNRLKILGLTYHEYHDRHRAGPPSWDECIAYARNNGLDATAIEQLRSDGYTVIWGLQFKDVIIGTSNFIVAYPSDAQTNGGTVLMLDGAVLPITAEQFAESMEKQKDIKPASPTSTAANASPTATAQPFSAPPTSAAPATVPAIAASDAPGMPVAADTPLAKGHKVYIHWGASWYEGEVLEAMPDGKVQIHYDEYDSTWDEAVTRDRLRLREAE